MANETRYSQTGNLNEKWVDLGDKTYAKVVATMTVDEDGTPQFGDGSGPKTDRSITASTSSQTAAPANDKRKKLLIQNMDPAINVHVNLGVPATTGLGSVRIAPNGFLEISGSSEALNIIAASGAPLVTIWEF